MMDQLAGLRPVAFASLCAALAACSSFEGAPVPTGAVRSSETARGGAYSPIYAPRGAQAPAPEFPAGEQARVRAEIEAARTLAQETARAPADRPLPR
jgi:hypothetical protein